MTHCTVVETKGAMTVVPFFRRGFRISYWYVQAADSLHSAAAKAQVLPDTSDSKAWLMSSSNSSQTSRTCFMTRQALT